MGGKAESSNFALQGLVAFELELLALPGEDFRCVLLLVDAMLDKIHSGEGSLAQSLDCFEVIGEALVGEAQFQRFVDPLQ